MRLETNMDMAVAMGYELRQHTGTQDWFFRPDGDTPVWSPCTDLPAFSTDLNIMHGVEKELSIPEWKIYLGKLEWIMESDSETCMCPAVHASAEQRCQAYIALRKEMKR